MLEWIVVLRMSRKRMIIIHSIWMKDRPIHQEELSIGEKDQLCQVDFPFSTHRTFYYGRRILSTVFFCLVTV